MSAPCLLIPSSHHRNDKKNSTDKKLLKHAIQSLPHPYNRPDHYERTINAPVGTERALVQSLLVPHSVSPLPCASLWSVRTAHPRPSAFFFFFFFHLGREWNTAEHHKRETRPAIETVPGAIIKPMKLTKV